MPPKKERKKGKAAGERGKKTPTMAKDTAICGVIVPGPQYKFKTLVGYKGHCSTMFRNPAYSFGKILTFSYKSYSPGPKYMLKEPKREGYTFGMAAVRRDDTIGPGPKYKLPTDRGPGFFMKWRTEQRKVDKTPDLGYVKPTADAPAFIIGLPLLAKVKTTPLLYTPCDPNVTKTKSPAYSIALPCGLTPLYRSPGPKYDVKLPRLTPAYSFGTKHSICAPPYITECDEQC